MRNLLLSLFFLMVIDLAFQSCANISSPTGGPRDTIPPILLASEPTNGTINFTENEISMEFSEFVKADKIQQQLIITPISENKYKTIVKKNQIILRFENPFKDSTTYNLNFADAITDITENNPVVNLSIAFSTGPFIDSLGVEGTIVDLFEQKEVEGYTVGLYPLTDTLDFFTDKPSYFTTSNDSGKFQLNYIKAATYKLLVFKDENKNIILDPETEPHGFIPDSIALDSIVRVSSPIQTVLQDVKPIKFINSRPTGPYIELKYSKYIKEYQIQPTYLQHSLTGESQDVIRIYKSDQTIIGDSLTIYSLAADSLGNEVQDTIKTAFVASNRKPAEFSYTAKLSTTHLTDNQQLIFEFNKPVLQFDSSKIYLSKDTIFRYAVSSALTWNENNSQLTLISDISRKAVLDSLLLSLPEDTTNTTTDIESTEKTETKKLPDLDFIMDDGAFISIEYDTAAQQTLRVLSQESSSYGLVKIALTTAYEQFTLQLVDSKDRIRYSASNKKMITFPKVTPETYSIRILIDNNLDGKWSAGNLLLNLVPEDIYLHPEETSVRENWDVNIDISF